MILENLTFKNGVHPSGNKEKTEVKAIEKAKEPEIVYIALHQHTGAPCEPIVEIGDIVKVGQKIGQSEAFVSAPVHSSVSGTVKDIVLMDTPSSQNVKCVVIESDGKDELHESVKPKASLDELSPKEILEIIKEAGITGMGGAGFPAHVKFSPQKKVDTVIINGAECEPYLTADHRVMLEYTDKLVFGLKAIMKALGVEKGIFGIESNKADAISALKEATKDEPNIEVATLKVKYPQGDEKRLIDAILGRTVPSGGLPMDVGAIVSNVSSTKAVADAILEGKPLYERVATITGEGIKEPKNLLVKIGTPFKDLIEQCGGFAKDSPGKIISGGPLMGIAQYSLDIPIIKGSNGILVLTKDEAKPQLVQPCIKCAKCIDACPVYLMPLYLSKYALDNNLEKAEEFHAVDCVECGACSYVCPSKRPLAESIRVAKREILAKNKKK